MSQPAEQSSHAPEILARGPWEMDRIHARWLDQSYEPTTAQTEAADEAIRGLQERGSPSHDGVAARLVDYSQDGEGISMEMQPLRWAPEVLSTWARAPPKRSSGSSTRSGRFRPNVFAARRCCDCPRSS